jgi:tetratricopeptide (TPR) repeat protein
LVKKASRLGFLAVLLASCVTYAPPPPNLYIENLPQSLVTPLTLEERIRMEEAWDFLRQGRLDRAEKAFLRLGPSSPLYSVGLGYVLLLQDNYPAAEENFGLAVKENPSSLLAYLGLVQLYQKTGEEDKVFNALREVLKIDPLNSWAKEGYANLKAQKTEQAMVLAREAAAQGEIEAAKESYLRALHYSPESVEIHLALAGLYRSENKISSALIHLKAAAASAPDNIAALQMYAATLAEAKQYDRSLDVYHKVLELDNGNKEARQQVEVLENRLGIVELPSRYGEIPMAAAVSREDIAALLAVKLKDVLEEPAAQPPIIIDISSSWASKFILKVTSLGLLEVHPNHAFQPKRTVTRAELARVLVQVIQYLESKGHRFIPQIPPNRIQVPDVSPDHFYYQPISQILSYQIMELFPDKTFRPDQPVPGLEAVKTIDILLALVR